MRRLLFAAALAIACLATTAPSALADYGIKTYEAGTTSDLSGAHGDLVTEFDLNRDGKGSPDGTSETLRFTFPPGFTGNPEAFPKCTAAELSLSATFFSVNEYACPIESQVGISDVAVYDLLGNFLQVFKEPVYNMQSPGGDIVARLGLVVQFFPTFIDVRADPEDNYALEATISGAASKAIVAKSTTVIWGNPTDPKHDLRRITPYEAQACAGNPCLAPGGLPRHSNMTPTAFIANPTRCGAIGASEMEARAYNPLVAPSLLSSEVLPELNGCEELDFEPKMQLSPSGSQADSPVGMDATIAVSQAGLDAPDLRVHSHLKRVISKLPEGLTLNPAAGSTLAGCSEAQVGVISSDPVLFDDSAASCPIGSRVGSAEIVTPVLGAPVKGDLYLATPNANPFGSLLAGYLVAEGQGVVLKLAGRFDLDPGSGQITATFDGNPQQPFDVVRLRFNGGPRGVLISPQTCGRYEINSRLSSWSALDPQAPTPAEEASSSSQFEIASGPGGRPCSPPRLGAALSAWSARPVAGAHSPVVIRITREDGEGRIAKIAVSSPPGIAGKLAGIPYCPEETIAALSARSGIGDAGAPGPACPPDSRVGTAMAGAGAGPNPLYITDGKVYLAGPYKGAPISLAVLTPAVAGPFDLGLVMVRVPLRVNPTNVQITADSDPLPTHLHGIPLALRDIRVLLDRDNFTINPTSCREDAFAATVSSPGGAESIALAQRFQLGGCQALGFKPSFKLTFFGKTRRGAYQRLKAVVRGRPGDSNIARAAVTLPPSTLLAQNHIRLPCTRVKFAAEQCPADSVYGRAKAYSPLLGAPLTGPVYLRTGDNMLPDLVADLRGPAEQPLRIELVGRTDTDRGALRNTFDLVPDAPVSHFELELFGGKRSLIQNSESICAASNKARIHLTSHSGVVRVLRPKVYNKNCGSKSGNRGKKSHK